MVVRSGLTGVWCQEFVQHSKRELEVRSVNEVVKARLFRGREKMSHVSRSGLLINPLAFVPSQAPCSRDRHLACLIHNHVPAFPSTASRIVACLSIAPPCQSPV